jgi:hypothetical protein
MKPMPNAYIVEGFSLKTTTVKNEFDVKNVYSVHPHNGNNQKIACVCLCL